MLVPGQYRLFSAHACVCVFRWLKDAFATAKAKDAAAVMIIAQVCTTLCPIMVDNALLKPWVEACTLHSA